MSNQIYRLTSLAHGGGCGCKIAPSVLQDILSGMPAATPYANLLVGAETSDDAAVWDLDGQTSIIATTDFFMPMVDDPYIFGRIAATNAISDIYAMGGTPIFALAIVGMPIDKMDPADIRAILAGGVSLCTEAGIPVAGGHSIDCPEPVYGLAVIGTCPTAQIKRNSVARPGDRLILTKSLGVGIYSAAIKKDELDADAYEEMIASTTLLNRIGSTLGANPAVHAMTDVTGFGILGHALEMARGAGVTVRLDLGALPFLREAERLLQAGFVTGASHRNWKSYGHDVRLPGGTEDWRRHLLTDPQTSGGLLIAVDPSSADGILETIRDAGYPGAAIIGTVEAGAPLVEVT
ncbi:selenide, water dikinase SelD [Aliihoeflea aestuarii]|jgi:selenide, water dikinase|uniref:selenide, water dikinase SelD n=1 Tax=Aliihoeflea aestuarii TaxID=453840 RepID=UPI002092C64F|nr:selenide, water dikinase SelD [Aliihoeflea aestuarii]MCO6390536.1 selenide, water dikinase SelD [Aliihoeflea aestuarii]